MNREVRDKLIVEALRGGCWHEWSFRSAAYMCSQESDYECEKCNEWKSDQEFNSLSTPNGFFWWWPRAQKMEWWKDFILHISSEWHYSLVVRSTWKLAEYINPDRGADALAEFLEARKK